MVTIPEIVAGWPFSETASPVCKPSVTASLAPSATCAEPSRGQEPLSFHHGCVAGAPVRKSAGAFASGCENHVPSAVTFCRPTPLAGAPGLAAWSVTGTDSSGESAVMLLRQKIVFSFGRSLSCKRLAAVGVTLSPATLASTVAALGYTTRFAP